MKIELFGYSDDLIEIEGDIYEEFNFFPDDANDTRLIAVSDGHLFRVRYDEDGLWRFATIANGTSTITKIEAIDDDVGSEREAA